MAASEFVFLGFAAVKPMDWTDWLGAHGLRFTWVASMDGWRPPDWADLWDFNLASCWDTEEDAWRFVPVGEAASYRLCAYRLLPVFFKGAEAPAPRPLSRIFDLDTGTLPTEPPLAGYRSLGFDVVGIGTIGIGPSIGYGTSPLSTSAMCRETPVNEYCLIDDLDAAKAFAARCNVELPEPEYFYVVEVLHRD